MNEFFSFIKEYFFFRILDFIGMPVLLFSFVFLLIVETVRQLRIRRVLRWSRVKTNIGVATTALFTLRIALIPVLVLVAKWTEDSGIGLMNWISLPNWLAFIAGFLLLDYGNYLWHVLNHRIQLLWRFHNVHHIDLDLDVTTAIRFHFGEILFSIFFRSLIIVAIGAPVMLVLVYEVVFETATNFHHSNWRLPFKIEKGLSYFIVTPRMHGVHHSIVHRETNSNYSVIFNIWDRLHKTIRLNVPQQEINIGVPSYRDPKEQTIKNLLIMPFKKQRPWQLPDGSIPERREGENKGRLVP